MAYDESIIKKMDAFVRGQLPEDEAVALRIRIAADPILKSLEKERLVEALMFEEYRRNQISQFKQDWKAKQKATLQRQRRWQIGIAAAAIILFLAAIASYKEFFFGPVPEIQTPSITPPATVPPPDVTDSAAQSLPSGGKSQNQKSKAQSTDITLNLLKGAELAKDRATGLNWFHKTHDNDPETAGGDITDGQSIDTWAQDTLKAFQAFRKGSFEIAATQFEALMQNPPPPVKANQYEMEWYLLLSRLCQLGADDSNVQRLMDKIIADNNQNFRPHAQGLKRDLEQH